MNNIDHCYTVEELSDQHPLTYLFFSEGINESEVVLKIIQFAYLQHFNNRPVFNLGFGDYDIGTKKVNDGIMTNNGDPYRIFNTVLSSIPMFYDKYPGGTILVQGSDGRVDFEANCRTNCVRNCVKACHNFNRRMRIYCAYVSRKLGFFEPEYQFFGGVRNDSDWFEFEDFAAGKIYDAILVFKRND